MRPIKFRIWDGDSFWYDGTVRQRYNDTLKKPYLENLMICIDGTIRICQWYDNGVTIHPYGTEKFILEQFTGLLDRNGREIYEGDVLAWSTMSFPVTVDDAHGYRFMWGKDTLCRGFVTVDDAHGYRFMWGKDTLCRGFATGEVIGNIHENPELLNTARGRCKEEQCNTNTSEITPMPA